MPMKMTVTPAICLHVLTTWVVTAVTSLKLKSPLSQQSDGIKAWLINTPGNGNVVGLWLIESKLLHLSWKLSFYVATIFLMCT